MARHGHICACVAMLQELEADPETKGSDVLPVGWKLGPVDADNTAESAGALRPLPFDDRQHALLRDELRQLYVAITRAKVGRHA